MCVSLPLSLVNYPCSLWLNFELRQEESLVNVHVAAIFGSVGSAVGLIGLILYKQNVRTCVHVSNFMTIFSVKCVLEL